jgi:tetratricopeptide (TPR) repeat protein
MKVSSLAAISLTLFLFPCFVFAQERNPLRALFEQGGQAMSEGNFQKAADLYQQTISIYPKFAAGYNFLALARKELGATPDEIIRLFKKSIEVDPRYPLAYENLAKIYYTMGDQDQASRYGAQAVALQPNELSSRLVYGWVELLGKNEPEKALEQFEAALKIEKISYAYYGLGLAYFKTQQRGKILEIITILRQSGGEDFARQLEEMLRTGQYKAPVTAPQILAAQKALLNEYPQDFENHTTSVDAVASRMKVRLRPASEAPPVPAEDQAQAAAPSSGSHLRALQRNSQQIPQQNIYGNW